MKQLVYPNKSHIKISIDDAKKLAYNRGGECLSHFYDPNGKLEWKCGDGHRWAAFFTNIKRGKWCPNCHINYGEEFCRIHLEWIFNEKFIKCRPEFLTNPKTGCNLELDGYCSKLGIAFEHNGRQHYEKSFLYDEDFEYRKKLDLLKIKLCNKFGVKLIILPDIFNILKPENCLNEIYTQLHKLNINFNIKNNYNFNVFMQQIKKPSLKLNLLNTICNSKDGKCLSNIYLGSSVPLEFICKNNHTWMSEPKSIFDGKWCKLCYLQQDPDGSKYLELKSLVESKGWTLLSLKYTTIADYYEIKCNKNHINKVLGHSIKKNTWCIDCHNISMVKDISDIKQHIYANNGKLLTNGNEIINSKSKIKILCNNNHIWEVEINSLRHRKHWCRFCKLEERK